MTSVVSIARELRSHRDAEAVGLESENRLEWELVSVHSSDSDKPPPIRIAGEPSDEAEVAVPEGDVESEYESVSVYSYDEPDCDSESVYSDDGPDHAHAAPGSARRQDGGATGAGREADSGYHSNSVLSSDESRQADTGTMVEVTKLRSLTSINSQEREAAAAKDKASRRRLGFSAIKSRTLQIVRTRTILRKKKDRS